MIPPHRKSNKAIWPHYYQLFHLLYLPSFLAFFVNGQSNTTFFCSSPFNITIPYPSAQHIPLESFQYLLATESQSEFEFDNNTLAEEYWTNSTIYEWCRSWNTYRNKGSEFPFLICDTEGGQTGATRRQNVIDDIMSNSRDADASNVFDNGNVARIASVSNTTEEPAMITIYNEQNYTCFIASITAADASSMSNRTSLYVHPLSYAMKLTAGTVSAEQNMLDDNKTDYVLDALLCPGVLDKNSTSIDNKTPEEINKEVMDFLRNTTDDNIAVFTEMFFWSVDEEGGNDRAAFWQKVFNESVNSDDQVCDPYFDRLNFTFSIFPQKLNTMNQMSVSFAEVNKYVGDGDPTLADECLTAFVISLSLLPEVCSLQVRPDFQTQNTIASWLVQSKIQSQWTWFDSGLAGQNQVVAISDTGIDINNCYFWDATETGKSFVQSPVNIDLKQRKVVQYDPYVNLNDYQWGHGTHVAGTVVGRKAPDGLAAVDGGYADGVAKEAKVAFIDIGTSTGGLLVPPIERLLSTGYPYAKIHSASWGSSFNGYGVNARSFDAYIYNDPEFLITVAAGNSGQGDAPNTVGDPATAKNIISVGAANTWGRDLTSMQLGPSYLAGFSSRGPTEDGRTKPDIVAPGAYILSAGAQPSQVGECDSRHIPDAGDRSDGLLSIQGTSMATPVVAGTAALVRQYFQEGWYPTGTKTAANAMTPSAALVKAVLMNGAEYLKGVDNSRKGTTPVAPYDNNQNFGHVSLVKSLYIKDKSDVNVKVWDYQVIGDRETSSFDVKIDTSGGCTNTMLAVTLVWTDPPSIPGCQRCVLNDLDLYVMKNNSSDNKKYYPNGLSNRDSINNAERVQITGVQNGDSFKISVNAYNLFTTSQTYALVATGCFGGSGNLIQGTDAYADDKSGNRLRNILLGVLIPLGVICLALGIFAAVRKRRADQEEAAYGYEEEVVESGPHYSEDL